MTYIPRPGTAADQISLHHILTATGVVPNPSGTVLLSHASVAIAATFRSLLLGANFLFVNTLGGTHTITLPAGMTFDGTNNRCTLNTAEEFVHFRVISATRVFIVGSSGAAYSAV